MPAHTRLQRMWAYRWLLFIAVVIIALDQLSKGWIRATLPFNTYGPPNHLVVIPGFFYIVHVGNTGAAWGLFAGKSFWLAILAVIAIAAIFVFRKHLSLAEIRLQIIFGLLCGGIFGNLLDRMIYGHVTDFLDFHFGRFVWPAFNLADAAICTGLGLYLIYSFREPQHGTS